MKREIIRIDEDKCNGCGLCIPNCHEGALQIVDGKARLISDLMCDGLGACIGHCPEGAITLETREAAPYDEIAVMRDMMPKGRNTMIAHLTHLKDHNEFGFLKEGIQFLVENKDKAGFNVDEVLEAVNSHQPGQKQTNTQKQQQDVKPDHAHAHGHAHGHHHSGGGCPGSREMTIDRGNVSMAGGVAAADAVSELRQWPVQMHLINPNAGYFQNSDLVIAADCVAFAAGNFHGKYLKGRSVAIACPKLDSNMEVYINKITSLIDDAKVNTITVMMMEVPCCGGLLRLVKAGADKAQRKVPVKMIITGINGDQLREEWV
ncbi:MAG: 4Fe-4S binding protein [Bacteroidales bacterium]|nr:4Fe-4S binding protein [Bacteroidales bacterium]